MRDYEVTVVIKADIEDDAREELLARLAGWLTHGEAEEDKPVADNWGRRTLAYPIKKHTEGYYLFYNARLDTGRIGETERNILYEDQILRHLFVRKDD